MQDIRNPTPAATLTGQSLPVTEEGLRRRVLRHNLLQVFLIAVLIPGTIVLWLLSYGIFYWAVDSVCDCPRLSFWAAWLGLAVLAWYGLRFRGPPIEPEGFLESEFGEYAQLRARRQNLSELGMVPLYTYVITSLPLAAPRTTVLAVQAFRAIVWNDSTAVGQAARMLHELNARRDWLPVAQFAAMGAGLHLLDRLGLIWTKLVYGEAHVRIPPGIKPSDFA